MWRTTARCCAETTRQYQQGATGKDEMQVVGCLYVQVDEDCVDTLRHLAQETITTC